MTHTSEIRDWEKFYPEGVRWAAAIEAGTLPDLLSRSAQEYGQRAAIEFRNMPLTYAALEAEAARMAAALLRDGKGREAAVALLVGNTPDHPINFFGVLKAAGRVVHLSPLDSERALVHKLTDSGARIVVASNISSILPIAVRLLKKDLIDTLVVCDDSRWGPSENKTMPLPDEPGVVWHSDYVRGAPMPASWPAIDLDDTALLQYTGGTTGLSKGAMLTHHNLTSAIAIHKAWGSPLRLSNKGVERVVAALPLFHIFGLSVLLSSFRYGDLVSLHQRFDVDAVLHDIEVNRATALPAVPTMWIALANSPGIDRRDISSLAAVGSGGAPLPLEVARVFEAHTGLRLRSGWGMTETSALGTVHPKDGPEKPGSIGLMPPGVEIEIVATNDPSRVLPRGQPGELRIRGPNVTRGYINRPKETAESFVDGYFLTGDVGYMDEDGFLFLVDRKKDMIISGGFNVYPQVIEQAIYEHPSVQEVLVIGIPDAYRGEAAKAFATLKAGHEAFSLELLREFLRDRLGKHELPAALQFVEQLPRTPAGKLSRHDLRMQQRVRSPVTA